MLKRYKISNWASDHAATIRKTMRRMLSVCVCVVVMLISMPITAQASLSTRTAGYGNLSGYGFTVTDVRDGKQYSFTPGDGNPYVLIFGNIIGHWNVGDSATEEYIKRLSRMIPYLDSRLKVFELDMVPGLSNEDMKTLAERYDCRGNLVIAHYDDGFYPTCNRCLSLTGYSSISFAFAVYIDGAGNICSYTMGIDRENGKSYSADEPWIKNETIIQGLGTIGVPDTYTGACIAPDVQTHTQEEIRAYCQAHPITYESNPFDVNPSFNEPYNIGKPNIATLNNALNAVNQIRYISGQPGNVVLYDKYCTYAQSACFVGALNYANLNATSGNLNYNSLVSRPSGISDEIYGNAQKGFSRSNGTMYWSTNSIVADKVFFTISETDYCKGYIQFHERMPLLTRSLEAIGFGVASVPDQDLALSSLFYANMDLEEDACTMTMWPAMNTPIEYFGNEWPWSISTGVVEDVTRIQVELKNTKTGQKWKFSSASSDGDFNVDNYMVRGSILFSPSGIDIKSGDVYSVKITGLADGITIAYEVNFFELGNGADGWKPSDSNEETENKEERNDNQINFDEFVAPEGCVYQFRLYNPNSGEHFYTGSQEETINLIDAGWNFEGSGFITPTVGIPIYRLYSAEHGDHFYTTSETERDALLADRWTLDGDTGIAFPSAPAETGRPMYRLHNPNAYPNGEAGAHHFTMSWEEVENLQEEGWQYEFIAWYSV